MGFSVGFIDKLGVVLGAMLDGMPARHVTNGSEWAMMDGMASPMPARPARVGDDGWHGASCHERVGMGDVVRA
jgi:hypothetical protein